MRLVATIILGLFCGLIAPAGCVALSGAQAAEAKPFAFSTRQALQIYNAYRRAHGLAPVRLDPVLTAAARDHARDMARHDRLGHSVSRGGFAARMARTGHRPSLAAENVSAGYQTVARAFEGWKKSRPHNRNLLLAGVRRIGIAAAFTPNGRYKYYWTLILASGEPTTSFVPTR